LRESYNNRTVASADSTASRVWKLSAARLAAFAPSKLSFSHRTYQQLFYVLDVKITRGFDKDLYINLDEHFLSLTFALLLSGMQRLIGFVPPELSDRVT
jgi:uncharacterized membrane protein